MLVPNDGQEFCSVGYGNQIHVRVTGPNSIASNRSRKPICGAVKGRRGMVHSVQDMFTYTAEEANRAISKGYKKLCSRCANLTHEEGDDNGCN